MKKNILELLALSKDFEITQNTKNSYTIELLDSNLAACIVDDKVEYFLTGCYDSGVDWHKIAIEELEKLKKFCKLMIED